MYTEKLLPKQSLKLCIGLYIHTILCMGLEKAQIPTTQSTETLLKSLEALESASEVGLI